MAALHKKVQQLVDSHNAAAVEEIAFLKEKLKQYETFDAQKASLEELINQLTEENKKLSAELEAVIQKSSELEVQIAAIEAEAKNVATEVPAALEPAPGTLTPEAKEPELPMSLPLETKAVTPEVKPADKKANKDKESKK